MNCKLRKADSYKQEAFVVEIAIQQIMDGHDIDLGSIDHLLNHEHWRNMLKKYASKYV